MKEGNKGKHMKKLLLLLSFVFAIFIHVDSAYAVDYPFSVTTTSVNSFQFEISAQGTFYVDCGTGGTLSGTGVSGTTITKNDTSPYVYTCTYSTTGIRTIRFGGTATAYGRNPAISFSYDHTNWNRMDGDISVISGNLSALFPYLGSGSGQQPSFQETFYECTNLTSIPENLFSGYTTGADSMFDNTFYGCTSLTSIPAGLFRNITTGSYSMFRQTFDHCTGLTSLPSGLFSGITTGAGQMFEETFKNCTGLTSIPGNLFSGITTGVNGMFNGTFSYCTGLTSIPAGLFENITTGAPYMFYATFYGCSGLTSIPAGLFKNITTGANNLFYMTFELCSRLTSIPENLFSGITTGASDMFLGTFAECSGLTSLPSRLFSNITTAATGLFRGTFVDCSNMTGYIPPTLFSGLIENGHPTADNMWYGTFSGTQLVTSCPSGYRRYGTGYEGSTSGTTWNGYVSCQPGLYHCDSGNYLPANSTTCATCPSGYTCDGGWFPFDPVNDQGLGINIINMTWDNGEYSTPASCAVGGIFLPPTPEPRPGYIFTGWKAKPKTTCSLTGVDASIDYTDSGYQNDSTGNKGADSSNTTTFGITTDNTWAALFSYGTVWGESACMEAVGGRRGGYECLCRVKYFQSTGAERCPVSPNPWISAGILYRNYGDQTQLNDEDNCAYQCASRCLLNNGMGNASVRATLFGQ